MRWVIRLVRTAAARSMRSTAAARMRCWGGRLISSGCFAHCAEYQETGKNHECKALANNPVKKLCRHRNPLFPCIVPVWRFIHETPSCCTNLAARDWLRPAAAQTISGSGRLGGPLRARRLQDVLLADPPADACAGDRVERYRVLGGELAHQRRHVRGVAVGQQRGRLRVGAVRYRLADLRSRSRVHGGRGRRGVARGGGRGRRGVIRGGGRGTGAGAGGAFRPRPAGGSGRVAGAGEGGA